MSTARRSLSVRVRCTTAQTSFVGTSTVCAHVVAQIQGGGSTAWAIHWYAPGCRSRLRTSRSRGQLHRAEWHGDLNAGRTPFAVSAVGIWTVVVCKTGNVNACSSGNQVETSTFTVTACAATAVTTNPIAQSITYGANATFHRGRHPGTPTPSVQWQVSSQWRLDLDHCLGQPQARH